MAAVAASPAAGSFGEAVLRYARQVQDEQEAREGNPSQPTGITFPSTVATVVFSNVISFTIYYALKSFKTKKEVPDSKVPAKIPESGISEGQLDGAPPDDGSINGSPLEKILERTDFELLGILFSLILIGLILFRLFKF